MVLVLVDLTHLGTGSWLEIYKKVSESPMNISGDKCILVSWIEVKLVTQNVYKRKAMVARHLSSSFSHEDFPFPQNVAWEMLAEMMSAGDKMFAKTFVSELTTRNCRHN